MDIGVESPETLGVRDTCAAYNRIMQLVDIVPTPRATAQASVCRRQFGVWRSAGRPATLLLGLGLLAACSLTSPPESPATAPRTATGVVTPSTTTTTPTPAEAVALARRAEERAAMESGEARRATLQSAVGYWLTAGDGGAAARVLAMLGNTKTPTESQVLLGVEVALAQGQPAKAAQWLDRLPAGTPPSAAIDWARARTALVRGQAAIGVRWAVEAPDALRTRGAARPDDRLWQQLRAAARRGADLSLPAGASPLVAGWLELARTAEQAAQLPARRDALLGEWRRRFPEHPANGPLVVSMLQASPSPSSPGRVALLLPLSGKAQSSGQTVRDGFLAAWYAQQPADRPEVAVMDTGTDAAGAYQRAVAEGATAVVGPLTKEEVVAVSRAADGRLPILALNFLTEGTPAPARLYQYSLAPEDEAIQVAQRLVAEGRRHGIALLPAGEWGARVLRAFESSLAADGGRLIAKRTYAPDTADFTAPILELLGVDEAKSRHQKLAQVLGHPLEFAATRRSNIEFVFIAGQPQAARLIRPQLRFHYAGDLPVYATSEVYDPNPKANLDLEGVMFPDMPWMIEPDPSAVDVRNDLRNAWPERYRRRGRLYALGFDAYAALAEVRGSRQPFANPVSGLTGRLWVDANRRLHRRLEWVQVRGGELRVLPPAGLPLPDTPAP